MEIVKIKTQDGEILLNLHNDEEIDNLKDELEDTINLHEVVNLNETE